ncbi:hypothetical protein AB0O01_03925 [Streptomyces sp. NPDC093252]|uniref:hypothetical protein n=1 Tax=Streptomyces sp. NPDC093252 TaxID=3154980 RepID=UPI0034359E99
MSWEEEWAQLKADAVARAEQAAVGMRLNQLPVDGGGSGAPGDGFAANAESIDGSSHLLLEIAGVLYEGRMDGENATMGRTPRSHPEVAANVEIFARYAKDQYTDAVVLLAALAGKLRSANSTYAEYDELVRRKLDSVLTDGLYTDAGDR